MRKIAIFVEGQTELIFVRDFLLKYFQYNVDIECVQLKNKRRQRGSLCPDSHSHFQIITVDGDEALISTILNREKNYWALGFEKIIGLRDLYSKRYRDKVGEKGKIEQSITTEFLHGSKKAIEKRSNNHKKIHVCFSIMEIESWILGIPSVFKNIDSRLNTNFINQNIILDLENLDPEQIFHPSKTIENIFKIVDEKYDKKEGNIESLLSSLTKEDYQNLLSSPKCNSFKYFVNKLSLLEMEEYK